MSVLPEKINRSIPVYIKGMLKWCKTKQLNPWGNWTSNIYIDAESRELFNELKTKGLKNELRKDDDGYFLIISRPSQKLMRGKSVTFMPPLVYDVDGNTFDSHIGNGSMGTAKMIVYPYKAMGKEGIAWRWEALKVHQLVEYIPENEVVKQVDKGLEKAGAPGPF